ncbi:MAG: hypothetical protein OTJ44_04345 [Planctomycetota bacterium]|nr:hypothetical protein [Planctomycetota bacterium]
MSGLVGNLWLEGEFQQGFLTWERGHFARVKKGLPPKRLASSLLDVRPLRIIPGFVDTLCHGYAGVGAPSGSPDELLQMARSLAQAGVTSALMGFYPSDLAQVRKAAKHWNAWRTFRQRGARVDGWHMEGPFLPKIMAGALPPKDLRNPSARAVQALMRASGGWLKMCTMAPELAGARSAARTFLKEGVIPSIGHTQATWGDCERIAIEGGISVTHCGNRMLPMTAREPGPMGWAMAGHALAVGVIPDGEHVSCSVLKLWANHSAMQASLMFQSDNLSHAGMPAKSFVAGGKRLHRVGSAARDTKGNLGGTLDALPSLLADRIADGTLTWAQVIRAGAEVPGEILGKRGKIQVGMYADCVVMNAEGKPVSTWVGGRSF